MKRCGVLLAALLVVLTATPGAQTTCVVSGKVSSTTVPLAGALVEALDPATGTVVASGVTDAEGLYTIPLDAAGTYDFRVTPPIGSGLGPARSPARVVAGPTTIDFVLVASGGARFSGWVLDAMGVGAGGKYISLDNGQGVQTSTHAAEDGSFALEVPPGIYSLGFLGSQSRDDSAEPGYYSVSVANLPLDGSVTANLAPPFKRVTVTVRDPSNNPVADVEIATSGVTTCEMTIAGLPACGSSWYSSGHWRTKRTNASGQVTLWLLPTPVAPPSGTYQVTATPPADSPFGAVQVGDIVVSGERTVDITLVPAVGLRGQVKDAAGAGSSAKYVILDGALRFQTQSGEDGTYALSVPGGTYSLVFHGHRTNPNAAEPMYYLVRTAPFDLLASRTEDLVPPVIPVTVIVRDREGRAVPNVAITTSSPETCELTVLGLRSCGSSTYYESWEPQKTDESGQTTLWLFPTESGATGNKLYQIVATPPAGSGLATKALGEIAIGGPATVEVSLAPSVGLQGRVKDAAGAGSAQKYVILDGALRFQTQSGEDGSYALSAPEGSYSLVFHGHRVNPDAAEPMYYLVRTAPFDLGASRTEDLVPPVTRVTVIVQDRAGNAVPNVAITTRSPEACELTVLGLRACGYSTYYESSQPQNTDGNGQATLWLFRTETGATGNKLYQILATPPPGSPFVLFAVDDIAVTGEKTVIIVLPFSHEPPVTEIGLAPLPGPDGTYADPVTVTLSPVASPGNLVEHTYYVVDGGPAQTYTEPFQVAGDATHTVRYWSVDSSGVTETPRTTTFQIATTVESLIAALEAACATGGITKPGVCESLLHKLSAAKAAVDNGRAATAVNILNAFLNELGAQRGKAVTERAYQVLLARTQAVVGRLQ